MAEHADAAMPEGAVLETAFVHISLLSDGRLHMASQGASPLLALGMLEVASASILKKMEEAQASRLMVPEVKVRLHG